MRTTLIALAAIALATPAFAQAPANPTSSPKTNPNAPVQALPGQPSNTPSNDTTISPPDSSGTRALRPAQNPDGTPRAQSPGNAPQLPGSKGQN